MGSIGRSIAKGGGNINRIRKYLVSPLKTPYTLGAFSLCMIFGKEVFERKYKENELKIAFTGMSNIGKSFRSEQLKQKKNFSVFSVDDAIQNELGLSSIDEMSKWMGYPYEENYKVAEKRYLDLEKKHTYSSLLQRGNKILDTTGSIIYLEESLLQEIRKEYLIVEFMCPETLLSEMIEEFFRSPKPVVWSNQYTCDNDEDPKEALRRCYPSLLKERREKYHIFADISLSGDISRDGAISVEAFWNTLIDTLPKE
jgi:shikimate kinase